MKVVLLCQLSTQLQESEREAMEKISELEKQLIQTTKEVELLKVQYAIFGPIPVSTLRLTGSQMLRRVPGKSVRALGCPTVKT